MYYQHPYLVDDALGSSSPKIGLPPLRLVLSSEVSASWYDGIEKSVKSEAEYCAARFKLLLLLLLLLGAVGIIGGEARLGLALIAHNPNVKAVVAAMLMGIFFSVSCCSLTLPLFGAVDGLDIPSKARGKEVFGAG